ncbi:protein SOGA3 [Cricetulus griseus]|uniref:Protein SOGA3 n=1 Tax=Cricetulus griseus TaxID=10029 RepID=A0A9J7G4N7_CRIGR|nr:protein SOGA3 [Cricetulus griseus]
MEAAGAWGRAGRGYGATAEAPARFRRRLASAVRPASGSPQSRARRAWRPREQGRHYEGPLRLPRPQPARTSAGGWEGAAGGAEGPRGGADGGDAGWRRSSAPVCPPRRAAPRRRGAQDGGPGSVPTCAFPFLLLRHLGAEPVAWEMPITSPAGRASPACGREPLGARGSSRFRPGPAPLPQPSPGVLRPRGVVY